MSGKVLTFLDTHFSDAQLRSVEAAPCCHGMTFTVKFNGSSVHFNHEQDWSWIEFSAPMSQSVSQLLHEDVLQQIEDLQQQDEGYQVVKLENHRNQEVLIWTQNKKCFVDTQGHSGQVLAQIIDLRHQPESVRAFVNQFAPNYQPEILVHHRNYLNNVKFIESGSTIYRYRVAHETFVDFDENGNMFYMQEEATTEKSVIANHLIEALPEGVINRLNSIDQSIVSEIIAIDVYNNTKGGDLSQRYGFTLKDQSFYLIDSDFKVVEMSSTKGA